MPNVVTISAEERMPVLAWQKGDQITWVDADGYHLPGARRALGPLVTIHAEDDLPLVAVNCDPEAPGLQQSTSKREASQPQLHKMLTKTLAPSKSK